MIIEAQCDNPKHSHPCQHYVGKPCQACNEECGPFWLVAIDTELSPTLEKALAERHGMYLLYRVQEALCNTHWNEKTGWDSFHNYKAFTYVSGVAFALAKELLGEQDFHAALKEVLGKGFINNA
jgi:hypothetical protein